MGECATYLQLRLPPDTLDNVCPPKMAFRMQNPVIEARLKMLGIITPKNLLPIRNEGGD